MARDKLVQALGGQIEISPVEELSPQGAYYPRLTLNADYFKKTFKVGDTGDMIVQYEVDSVRQDKEVSNVTFKIKGVGLK
ncbi:MAG: hypothetical protein DRP85_07595 [Candidatus Makaraimicrobium thalassicum]|nr:MAG: hypothetical protein DRP85_07595 [Candidatus Omnitrophota bacterium]